MTAIRAEQVTKRYGDTLAVDGVSLRVEVGEFVGILGPNGAGKTTFLEIVMGLRRPDSGTVEVLGAQPWGRSPAQVRRTGVQFQASAFFERLTAREQLRTFASLYDVGAAAADGWLDRVGLGEKAGTRTDALSGGQRQRLAIACALVHEPELVFFDEPTAALDPQARRNLWDLLRSLQDEGRTVVLTTHHLDEAEVLCDRVAIMDHGRVLVEDRPAAIVSARVVVTVGIALVQMAVFVGLAVAVFGLRLGGSWWLAVPLLVLGTLCFMTVGLLAGGLSRTAEGAVNLANFVVLPMAFLSGSFFPLDGAPGWLRAVASVLPLFHLNEGMLDVLVRGEGLSSVLAPAGFLVLFGVVVGGAAVLAFRRRSESAG